MHTYSNLEGRTKRKPCPEVIACSSRVPLVHAVRGGDNLTGTIANILINGILGGVCAKPTKSTEHANLCLGIPSGSSFFYAGRVFPEVGAQVVLLFGGGTASKALEQSPMESRLKGSARPFDSGGLARGKTKIKWQSFAKNEKDYFQQHNLADLTLWRRYFALFLEKFFASPKDYWESIPKVPIDQTTFKAGDPWRDWTFEINFEAPVTLDDAGDILIDDETFQRLRFEAGWSDRSFSAATALERCRISMKPHEEAEETAKRIALM